ncbi:hypothetical protein ONZ43_g3260 [Nemania bipapillata]|uniref:Uncharacterized protein n=1 Tax=Nemania bipapillata TaxID=110536 RepID=A0ACC2IXK5_9PEZI|nr:hypothetical protein ONZ43_g3260 [Nemania bipapillata]
MGELFYEMGFLSTPKVIECSATDLLGYYVGHTDPETQKKLQDALGRVLFIDEAYRLIHDQSAKSQGLTIPQADMTRRQLTGPDITHRERGDGVREDGDSNAIWQELPKAKIDMNAQRSQRTDEV